MFYYQNFIDPSQADYLHAYCGGNLARLQAVKRTYDPGNVFHAVDPALRVFVYRRCGL